MLRRGIGRLWKAIALLVIAMAALTPISEAHRVEARLGALMATDSPPVSLTVLGPRPRWLHADEQQIATQVNVRLRQHWNVPSIRFAPGGIPIRFARGAVVADACGLSDVGGCHAVDASNAPTIWITYGTAPAEQIELDHEILETLVDPGGMLLTDGYLAEICDPVQDIAWDAGGVYLTDFVYPRYYQTGSHGPWDDQGQTSAPLDPSQGVPPITASSP